MPRILQRFSITYKLKLYSFSYCLRSSLAESFYNPILDEATCVPVLMPKVSLWKILPPETNVNHSSLPTKGPSCESLSHNFPEMTLLTPDKILQACLNYLVESQSLVKTHEFLKNSLSKRMSLTYLFKFHLEETKCSLRKIIRQPLPRLHERPQQNKTHVSLANVAQLVRALSRAPKGYGFDF